MSDARSRTRRRRKKPQTGHGPRQQDKLPREQKLLEIPVERRICPACSAPLKEMKGQTETTEQITMRAREYFVQLLVAPKYRCKCGIGVHTAPKPLTHMKGGRYSLDFAIEVAVDKYISHLPLDRQRRAMARAGLVVDTQTLWDQIEGVGEISNRRIERCTSTASTRTSSARTRRGGA